MLAIYASAHLARWTLFWLLGTAAAQKLLEATGRGTDDSSSSSQFSREGRLIGLGLLEAAVSGLMLISALTDAADRVAPVAMAIVFAAFSAFSGYQLWTRNSSDCGCGPLFPSENFSKSHLTTNIVATCAAVALAILPIRSFPASVEMSFALLSLELLLGLTIMRALFATSGKRRSIDRRLIDGWR